MGRMATISRDSGAGAYSHGMAWPSPRPQPAGPRGPVHGRTARDSFVTGRSYRRAGPFPAGGGPPQGRRGAGEPHPADGVRASGTRGQEIERLRLPVDNVVRGDDDASADGIP